MSASTTRQGRVTRENRGPGPSSIQGRTRDPLRFLVERPFRTGFLATAGALLALWLGGLLLSVSSILVEILVAFFLAAGLNPVVEFFERRGLKRHWAVLAVVSLVVLFVALFLVALVPVIADQVTAIVKNTPDWTQHLLRNRTLLRLDRQYNIIDKIQAAVTNAKFGKTLFGGVIGVGFAVLNTVLNAFVVFVLTLYFLAGLPRIKKTLYGLAPASQRRRVGELGDEILGNVGSYVSGAFVVALCAGVSTLVFLFVIGLGQYAVALALVVALLDVIPMIGATLGAVIVTAIAFATSPTAGLSCLVFYIVYQQFENYVVYPRVMARSVDIPGSVIVIAALVGASLLGVIGALLAIPTAAAVLLLVKEVYLPRQDSA